MTHAQLQKSTSQKNWLPFLLDSWHPNKLHSFKSQLDAKMVGKIPNTWEIYMHKWHFRDGFIPIFPFHFTLKFYFG